MSLHSDLLFPNELLVLIAENLDPVTFCKFLQSCKLFRYICDSELLGDKQIQFCKLYNRDPLLFGVKYSNIKILKSLSDNFIKENYDVLINSLNFTNNSEIITFLLHHLQRGKVCINIIQDNAIVTSFTYSMTYTKSFELVKMLIQAGKNENLLTFGKLLYSPRMLEKFYLAFMEREDYKTITFLVNMLGNNELLEFCKEKFWNNDFTNSQKLELFKALSKKIPFRSVYPFGVFQILSSDHMCENFRKRLRSNISTRYKKEKLKCIMIVIQITKNFGLLELLRQDGQLILYPDMEIPLEILNYIKAHDLIPKNEILIYDQIMYKNSQDY